MSIVLEAGLVNEHTWISQHQLASGVAQLAAMVQRLEASGGEHTSEQQEQPDHLVLLDDNNNIITRISPAAIKQILC